jgi:hypothetical protein
MTFHLQPLSLGEIPDLPLQICHSKSPGFVGIAMLLAPILASH